MRASLPFSLVLLSLILGACGGGGGGGGGGSSDSGLVPGTVGSVQVAWAANREAAVNRPGGGYKVHFSRTSGFDISTASVVDVPYASGALAPTSTTIANLASGTYFIKVVAYSALSPTGGGGGSASTPSSQTSVTVP